MTDRAMKIRMFNAWEDRAEGPYLLVSTSSKFDARESIDPGEGDFITEHDVWIEIPGRPAP